MAGPLKNDQYERIAQELAKGSADYDAYRAAGYKGSRPAASQIINREDIQARVAELLQRAAVRAETTVADIARQLDEDREKAAELGQAGAMVSASMGKAKVLGLIVDRQELSGRNGGPVEYRNLDEDEIDARLRALAEKNAGPDRPLAH